MISITEISSLGTNDREHSTFPLLSADLTVSSARCQKLSIPGGMETVTSRNLWFTDFTVQPILPNFVSVLLQA